VQDLDAFAERFAAAAIPKAEWTHAAHLAIGAWHVTRFGPDEALPRLRAGIRRLNDSHGTPNTETSGYHETITAAYLRLLGDFLAACPPDMPLAARVDRLLAGPLGARDVLLRFYTRETLMSARARAEWVEPDVAPLAPLTLR
jgi:hypothetical protein